MFIYQSLILNATENLLNMQVVRSGTIYLIIYRMHHQWRHLNMPIRNLILNTGTLTEGSNITNERFYIILMSMIYFFYICHIICIVYIVYNHTEPNWKNSLAEFIILYKYIEKKKKCYLWHFFLFVCHFFTLKVTGLLQPCPYCVGCPYS